MGTSGARERPLQNNRPLSARCSLRPLCPPRRPGRGSCVFPSPGLAGGRAGPETERGVRGELGAWACRGDGRSPARALRHRRTLSALSTKSQAVFLFPIRGEKRTHLELIIVPFTPHRTLERAKQPLSRTRRRGEPTCLCAQPWRPTRRHPWPPRRARRVGRVKETPTPVSFCREGAQGSPDSPASRLPASSVWPLLMCDTGRPPESPRPQG